jgi:hypothetical protein
MLFRETVAVYCENHTEHTNTLFGQKVEFWYVNTGGSYGDHGLSIDLSVYGSTALSWTLVAFSVS